MVDRSLLVHAINSFDEDTAVQVVSKAIQARPELALMLVNFAVPDFTYPPAKVLTERRAKGILKSLDTQEGCGYIECLPLKAVFGDDVYVDRKQMRSSLSAGMPVSFVVCLNAENKPQAFDVVPMEEDLSMPAVSAGMPGGILGGMPGAMPPGMAEMIAAGGMSPALAEMMTGGMAGGMAPGMAETMAAAMAGGMDGGIWGAPGLGGGGGPCGGGCGIDGASGMAGAFPWDGDMWGGKMGGKGGGKSDMMAMAMMMGKGCMGMPGGCMGGTTLGVGGIPLGFGEDGGAFGGACGVPFAGGCGGCGGGCGANVGAWGVGDVGGGSTSDAGPVTVSFGGTVHATGPVLNKQNVDEELRKKGGAGLGLVSDQSRKRKPDEQVELGMLVGTIKSFNSKGGYGFVDCPELKARGYSNDAFLHESSKGEFEVGNKVIFMGYLNGKGQPQAKELQPFVADLLSTQLEDASLALTIASPMSKVMPSSWPPEGADNDKPLMGFQAMAAGSVGV